MKIIFLENREKTFFWDAIAKELKNDNHEIFWIIQNHAYNPKNGTKNFIQYPSNKDLIELNENDIELNDILLSDRMFNYFNLNGSHYKYYHKQISNILNEIKPNVIFGESTLFHELITINISKKMKIPYFNPQPSSYPTNSFTFYEYDSKSRFKITNNNYPDRDYENIVRKMEERKLKIDYMAHYKRKGLFDRISRRIKQIFEYLKGEKYNTPGLFRKLYMNYKRAKNFRKWNQMSIKLNNIEKNKKILFYPLQQQPEANIDVWGKKYQDQTKIIYELKKNLPQNWELVLKTNPKKRYEISDKMIKIIKDNGIITLDPKLKMDDIIQKVDLIVTNTGTISIESIFFEKPIINLSNSISDNAPGTFKLDKYEDLDKILNIVENEEFLTANFKDKVQFMKKISFNTFEGIIGDPVHNPNCLNKKNIVNVVDGFRNTLKNINHF